MDTVSGQASDSGGGDPTPSPPARAPPALPSEYEPASAQDDTSDAGPTITNGPEPVPKPTREQLQEWECQWEEKQKNEDLYRKTALKESAIASFTKSTGSFFNGYRPGTSYKLFADDVQYSDFKEKLKDPSFTLQELFALANVSILEE